MSDTVGSLLRDMLVWIDASPRSYAEVMEAWRTFVSAPAGVGGSDGPGAR